MTCRLPGAHRCDPKDGVPATVRADHPDASALYSNFKVGAQSIYRVDLKAGTIRWVEEHRAFAPVNTFCGGPCPATRWCHSAKFVPGSPRLIVATSTKPIDLAGSDFRKAWTCTRMS